MKRKADFANTWMNVAPPFVFKKFIVHHERCALKVGTDAVLLGAWVDLSNAYRILDVGTGSGVIALMLAQRTTGETRIDGIEIMPEEASQARENVITSPWSNKISIFEKSLQSFKPGFRYNLIVSNPPYFSNSLKPSSTNRANARHTDQLTFKDLIAHSVRLLEPTGRLAVILPTQEGNQFRLIAEEEGLYLNRQLAFFSRKGKPQERWLFEFGETAAAMQEETLILYEQGDSKSKDYLRLTKDFYL